MSPNLLLFPSVGTACPPFLDVKHSSRALLPLVSRPSWANQTEPRPQVRRPVRVLRPGAKSLERGLRPLASRPSEARWMEPRLGALERKRLRPAMELLSWRLRLSASMLSEAQGKEPRPRTPGRERLLRPEVQPLRGVSRPSAPRPCVLAEPLRHLAPESSSRPERPTPAPLRALLSEPISCGLRGLRPGPLAPPAQEESRRRAV